MVQEKVHRCGEGWINLYTQGIGLLVALFLLAGFLFAFLYFIIPEQGFFCGGAFARDNFGDITAANFHNSAGFFYIF